MKATSKVILITGTSSGIGEACAEYLASQGHRVYGTSRRPRAELVRFREVEMDVTDDASVRRVLDAIGEHEGRIDVVINNAGFGYAGAIEDTSIEEARLQLETNFLGVLRVCRLALPRMRAQGKGQILNISSIGGLIAVPFQGMYCASKFALEGMTEALRMEVKPFGIQVSLVEPGDFRTRFTHNRVRTRASGQGSAYAEQFRRTLDIIERDEQRGPEPAAIARLVARIIDTRKPRLRYSVGMAPQRLAIVLRRLLPGRVFERLIETVYKL